MENKDKYAARSTEGSLLIDTIIAQFECIDAPPGDNWESTTTTRGSATLHRYSRAIGTIRLATYGHRDGRIRMRVEASWPKIILGHNILILTLAQIRQAGIDLQREVERLAPYIVVPPVETWTLAEVHWCDAWKVDSPSAAIDALAATAPQTKAQRTTREDDGRGGHTFRRQPRSGRGEWSEQAYDKGAETLSLLAKDKINLSKCGLSAAQLAEMAHGVLRFEVVTRRKALRAILGAGPTVAVLYDYLDAQGSAFIKGRWERLSVNWKPTPEADVARELRANYTPSTAADLFNFWLAVTHIGASEYKQLTEISAEKWRRQIARLTKVGLGLGQPVYAEQRLIVPFGG